MDRRKTEIQNQFQRLTQECELTVELLNKLLQINASHVNAIKTMQDKDFRMHSKYFIAVSQFQHMYQQKILELNVDLEDHILTQQVPSIEQFKVVNSCHSTPFMFANSEVELPSPPLFVGGPVFSNFNSFEKPTTRYSLNNSAVQHDFMPLHLSTTEEGSNNQDISFEAKESKLSSDNMNQCIEIDNETKAVATIPELNDTVKELEEISTGNADEPASVNCQPLVNVNESVSLNCQAQEENFKLNSDPPARKIADLKDILNDSTSDPSDVPNLSNSESSSNVKTDHLEVPSNTKSGAPNDVYETLKSMHLLTGPERWSDLPVIPMPEIALRPCPNPFKKDNSSSSTYPPNSTSSSGNSKQSNGCITRIEKKRKKKKGKEVPVLLETERILETNIPESFSEQIIKISEIKNSPAPRVNDICMIGYAETPMQFYIQVADEISNLIDKFEAELADINSITPFVCASKSEAMKKLGKFCSALIDDCWYRVEVIDWMMNADEEEKNKVFLQLIDYGSCFMLNYMELCPLPPHFNYPRIAQLCHLPYLYPLGSTVENKLTHWSEDSKHLFWESCGNLNKNLFRIVHVLHCPDKDSFAVDLVPLGNNYGITIGHNLKLSGAAVEIIDENICNVDLLDDFYTPWVTTEVMMNQIQKAHGRV